MTAGTDSLASSWLRYTYLFDVFSMQGVEGQVACMGWVEWWEKTRPRPIVSLELFVRTTASDRCISSMMTWLLRTLCVTDYYNNVYSQWCWLTYSEWAGWQLTARWLDSVDDNSGFQPHSYNSTQHTSQSQWHLLTLFYYCIYYVLTYMYCVWQYTVIVTANPTAINSTQLLIAHSY